MSGQAERIRARYGFTVLRQLRGSAAVDVGVATLQQQIRQAKQERVLYYVDLEVAYHGYEPEPIGIGRFSLEDGEGYFIDAADPEIGKFAGRLEPGGRSRGGLVFSLYGDLEPARLWFDTQRAFDESRAPLLVEIPLGQAPAHDSSGAWQVTATRSLDRQSARTTSEVPAPTPADPSAVLAPLARQLPWPYRRLSTGLMFRVALPGGRRQHVLMSATGRDEDGAPLVRFLTICAPIEDDGDSYEWFLRTNPRLAYGSLGIVEIDGRDYYVMTHALAIETAGADELVKTIGHLAQWGDSIEARLTGGADLR